MTDLESFDDETDNETLTPFAVPNVTPATTTLSPKLWNAFCYDLVFADMKYPDVCKSYGITDTHLLDMLCNPKFADRLKACKKEVKELGPNAAFVLSARAEAATHIQTLSNIASHAAINAGVRVRAIESLVRFADLDPSTQKADKAGTNSGVMVQFVIGGGLLGSDTSTINVTPLSNTIQQLNN